MITSLKSLQYEARLQELGLWTLEERRNRADLIEVFKMAHGFSAIPLTDMFHIDTRGRTRGHSLKLVKCRCNKDIRKYFFSHRVVSKWNMLDNDSVMAKTVNGFKTKLERERAKKMGLGSPGSNRSRTLSHVLLSKLPNPVTSLPSSGLYTG